MLKYRQLEDVFMNEVTKALLTRRSCRNFKADCVEKEKIDAIIEAGMYAASGMNRQPWLILAITNKEVRDQLQKMNAKIMGKDESVDPFYGAPVVLVVLADKAAPTYVYDGALMMGNLMLEAHNQGLASCWIHRAKEEFYSEEGKALLAKYGIEGDYEGIGHCVIGYPATELNAPVPRKGKVVYID